MLVTLLRRFVLVWTFDPISGLNILLVIRIGSEAPREGQNCRNFRSELPKKMQKRFSYLGVRLLLT